MIQRKIQRIAQRRRRTQIMIQRKIQRMTRKMEMGRKWLIFLAGIRAPYSPRGSLSLSPTFHQVENMIGPMANRSTYPGITCHDSPLTPHHTGVTAQ